MLAWTWRTWPDPLVDYGREAYLAWQVARGKTLYLDVAHFNGPLLTKPRIMSLAFALAGGACVLGSIRIAGPSILALALTNAALAAGCIAMLYSILVRVTDRLAATLAGITFVTLFACARFVPGRIPIVVPPAIFAPRAAAAITSPSPPVTTVQPRAPRLISPVGAVR